MVLVVSRCIFDGFIGTWFLTISLISFAHFRIFGQYKLNVGIRFGDSIAEKIYFGD